jgi:hypothetical protein
MKITGYTDENFQRPIRGNPYKVMINPDLVKWQRSVEYNETQPPDSSSPSQKYKSTPSDVLDFDIVIDCTGIVDENRTSMAKELDTLKKIVFSYNGQIHRPNFVKVQWGNGIMFEGVLMSFNTSYTLFRRDGSALRAKVSLSFKKYISPAKACKAAGKQSPDVIHRVNVLEGVSLPQLCQQVWNDDSYYIQVAQYNRLNKFRNLKGVTRLIFPPLVQQA